MFGGCLWLYLLISRATFWHAHWYYHTLFIIQATRTLFKRKIIENKLILQWDRVKEKIMNKEENLQKYSGKIVKVTISA